MRALAIGRWGTAISLSGPRFAPVDCGAAAAVAQCVAAGPSGFFCGALWASRLFGDAGDVSRASRSRHASRPVSTLSTSD